MSVWTWRQAKERGLEPILPHSLRRSQPCQHLDVRLQPPELCDNKFLLFKPPSLWYTLCYDSPRKLSVIQYYVGGKKERKKIRKNLMKEEWDEIRNYSFIAHVIWKKYLLQGRYLILILQEKRPPKPWGLLYMNAQVRLIYKLWDQDSRLNLYAFPTICHTIQEEDSNPS